MASTELCDSFNYNQPPQLPKPAGKHHSVEFLWSQRGGGVEETERVWEGVASLVKRGIGQCHVHPYFCHGKCSINKNPWMVDKAVSWRSCLTRARLQHRCRSNRPTALCDYVICLLRARGPAAKSPLTCSDRANSTCRTPDKTRVPASVVTIHCSCWRFRWLSFTECRPSFYTSSLGQPSFPTWIFASSQPQSQNGTARREQGRPTPTPILELQPTRHKSRHTLLTSILRVSFGSSV